APRLRRRADGFRPGGDPLSVERVGPAGPRVARSADGAPEARGRRRPNASGPRAAEGARQGAGGTVNRPRSVLVVDDDAHILEVLEMRLTSMGFAVTATVDAEAALAALGTRGFDAALFDLRMDPIDGIALTRAAHARQPRLPVLIMTAHGSVTMGGAEGRATLAVPLMVAGTPEGALVVENPSHVVATDDDLDLLRVFASQGAVALGNARELSRLRSGALAALGRVASQVA